MENFKQGVLLRDYEGFELHLINQLDQHIIDQLSRGQFFKPSYPLPDCDPFGTPFGGVDPWN